MCLVLRQDITDHTVQEIFIKLSHETEHGCTASLSGNVLNISNKFPFCEKAVNQTYDGAVVIADRLEVLHKLIGDKYATVLFVHC
jgi:hypothetical protein